MKNKIIKCFKSYDIRGRVPDELNAEIAYCIGNAMAKFLGAKTIVLGRDIRSSSQELADSTANGLMDAGVNVIDIGLCGTEEVYFATGSMDACGGIMITASHNPSDYNGLKLVRENSKPISSDSGLESIRDHAESNERYLHRKKGKCTQADISTPYIESLLSFINLKSLKPLKVVVNPGNGGASIVVDQMIEYLPFDFIKVHYEPDATFPNGVPNPMIEENRQSTITSVIANEADLGIAWDGDFDRCFFFDEKGEFVEGYYIVGLLAKSLLLNNKNARVIYDPRLTWNTIEVVKKHLGKPIQSRSGHSFIKQSMREEDALYGGEMSAHHYFRDFYYCDSGMIPWLLITELMSNSGESLSSMIAEYKNNYPVSGEINRSVKDVSAVIRLIRKEYEKDSIHIDTTDGISLEFVDWRFNLRASNTEPLIRLNVESRGDRKLMQLKTEELLSKIENSLRN